MASNSAWLQSESPCEPVEALSEKVESKIWFKSKPVESDFCYRVTQLQLCTDSWDQGNADDKRAGSWTWFEMVILADENSDEPKKSKEGKELVWRSHRNRLANDTSPTRHFGAVFDRRSELLANFEVGDVLAVRVCAQFRGWKNHAVNGYIIARVINEDLFTPHRWTLDSDVVPTLSEGVDDGSYSFVSTTPCVVKSDGNDLVSKIWFTTAALDQSAINRFEAIQLSTTSRLQESQKDPIPEGDSFSWFDLVILDTPKGKLYDVEDQDVPDLQHLAIALKGSLKPGNAIGVRVNAQYPGWENYAQSGQLVVRISNESAPAIPTIIPDVTDTEKGLAKAQKAMEKLYGELNYTSVTIAALSNEARADIVFSPPPAYSEVKSRPLRLLSCDGGGVRGVSSLRILKSIMKKVAQMEGKPNIKPCEYFDLMVGTSTGGLIALMLGRLHMTVEQCEAKYDEISKKVFGPGPKWSETVAFGAGWNMYNAKDLEDAIKVVVADQLKSKGEDLLLEDQPQCRVLVMSALASVVEDGNTAVHLRNYKTGVTIPSESLGWKIWEAGRATSAAPVYFERFSKGGLEFVDGGLGWNNPTLQLIAELPGIYGKDFTVGCVVSLGTGAPPMVKLGTGLKSVPDFIGIATNSERTHNDCAVIMDLFPINGDKKYWRFNMNKIMSKGDWVEEVVRGLLWDSTKQMKYEDIMAKMDDWEAIWMIRALTDKWLGHVDVIQSLNTCAAKLSMK